MSKQASHLIKALDNWSRDLARPATPPEGVWGRVCVVRIGSNITIDSKDLDADFQIPFDDDMEPNEATITLFNLSKLTTSGIKKGDPISVTAGYEGDTGVVFSGFISETKSKWAEADRQIIIKAFDDMNPKDKKLDSISYSKGTKASKILRDLIDRLKLPVAVFSAARDHTYDSAVTVDGDLAENIRRYAQVCGISVFISKGKVFARKLSEGENLNFIVSKETGLIGEPEEFTEKQTIEGFEDEVRGWRVRMLLQHRIAAGGIIHLKSRQVTGTFRVRNGEHSMDDAGAITEFEVV